LYEFFLGVPTSLSGLLEENYRRGETVMTLIARNFLIEFDKFGVPTGKCKVDGKVFNISGAPEINPIAPSASGSPTYWLQVDAIGSDTIGSVDVHHKGKKTTVTVS
jgi:hypothetical protein